MTTRKRQLVVKVHVVYAYTAFLPATAPQCLYDACVSVQLGLICCIDSLMLLLHMQEVQKDISLHD